MKEVASDKYILIEVLDNFNLRTSVRGLTQTQVIGVMVTSLDDFREERRLDMPNRRTVEKVEQTDKGE